jgi:hypothetical protein
MIRESKETRIMKTWKLKGTNIVVEKNDDGHYYLIAGKVLVNRLDSFNTSYQLWVLRSIGEPESGVK